MHLPDKVLSFHGNRLDFIPTATVMIYTLPFLQW